MSLENVSLRLAALREVVDLNQLEMSEIAQVDPSSYTKIEKGMKPLKPEWAFNLSEYFDISMDYFYRGKTNHLPEDIAPKIRQRLGVSQK